MPSNTVFVRVRLDVKPKLGDRLLELSDKLPFALQAVLLIPVITMAVLLLPLVLAWAWYRGILWVNDEDLLQKVLYSTLALFGWLLVINTLIWFFVQKTLFVWPL